MKDNSTGKNEISVIKRVSSMVIIYLFPLRDPEDEYDQLTLYPAIYYPIMANTQPSEAFESSPQLFTKFGIVLQPGHGLKYSLCLDTVNRAQFSGGPRLPLDPIRGHTPEGGLRVPSGALPGASVALPQ